MPIATILPGALSARLALSVPRLPRCRSRPPRAAAQARRRSPLRAGHLWVFSNEVDNDGDAAARRSRRAIVRSACPSATSSSATPMSIRMRSSARASSAATPPIRSTARSSMHRLQRGAGAARAAVPRAVLSAASSASPTACRARARPLWRRARRADRDGRHGSLKADVEAAVRAVLAPRGLLLEERLAARASSSSCRSSPRPPSASVPDELDRASRRACASRRRSPQGQKTGWFYDQTANRARLRALPAGRARACWTCAAMWAPGPSPR